MNAKGSKAKNGDRSGDPVPTVLFPLSGKARPDKADVDVLLKDRESLEGLVSMILADRWLVWIIVSNYLEANGLVIVPEKPEKTDSFKI